MSCYSDLLHSNCPSCGAEVSIRSASAVTAVCGYCHSVLLINQNKLIQAGRESAVLNDLSPLQIGTTGYWQGQSFILVGRLQVHYDAGMWNEWHALMQDGSSAWLSEANDRFVFTRQQTASSSGAQTVPQFDKLKIGRTFFKYGSRYYAVADIREITRGKYAAEGELPIALPKYDHACVADCRNGSSFITLDYSADQTYPQIFLGQGVTLKSLKLSNTRSPEQIRTQAGRIKGKVKKSKCPHCGGEIFWVRGVADYVLCQYCGSGLEMNAETKQVFAAKEIQTNYENSLTIKIGSKARIGGKIWWVLGAMVLMEKPAKTVAINMSVGVGVSDKFFFHDVESEGEDWIEYLLYAPDQGFLWLLELNDNQWALATTLDDWPDLVAPLEPLEFQRKKLPCLYDYAAEVCYAVGAFYWRVTTEDRMLYVDFGSKRHKLSTTLTNNEQSWSVVSEIPASLVATWFQADKDIHISKKILSQDKADQIVNEHCNLKAIDFNSRSIRKWRWQELKKSCTDIYSVECWLFLYIIMNSPAFIMIYGSDVFDLIEFFLFAVMVFLTAWCVLVGLDETEGFFCSKKFFPLCAFLSVIGLTCLDYSYFQDESSETSTYSSHSGRWHK